MQLISLGRLADVVLEGEGKVAVVGGDPGEEEYCPRGQIGKQCS
jgi:hypothetical protein